MLNVVRHVVVAVFPAMLDALVLEYLRIVIEADRRYAEPLLAKPPNESELRVDLVNGSVGVAWLTFTRPQVSTSRMSPQPPDDQARPASGRAVRSSHQARLSRRLCRRRRR
jgi:hypothetical protein